MICCQDEPRLIPLLVWNDITFFTRCCRFRITGRLRAVHGTDTQEARRFIVVHPGREFYALILPRQRNRADADLIGLRIHNKEIIDLLFSSCFIRQHKICIQQLLQFFHAFHWNPIASLFPFRRLHHQTVFYRSEVHTGCTFPSALLNSLCHITVQILLFKAVNLHLGPLFPGAVISYRINGTVFSAKNLRTTGDKRILPTR